MTERVRVAPSPTGYLHIGVSRAALFNYLYAKKVGGEFVLRIEDTDRARSEEKYVDSIRRGFEWFGIAPDEPPIRQSERGDYYTELLDRLVAEGKAYYTKITADELKAIRESDRPYRDDSGRAVGQLDPEEGRAQGAAIRLKTPREGVITVEDRVYGSIDFNLSEVEDFVIAKGDGAPTYHFAVVADDHAQGITLVLRGNDLQPSCPKHVLIYRALGWDPPAYAHLPMVLGTDKQKLSKRHGATSLLAYRAMGYLPQAMRNYLVRLGWSFGDEEVFQLEEMIEKFSLEGIGKSPAVFNPEKLLWLNGEHIRATSVKDLTEAWLDHLEHLEADGVYLEDPQPYPLLDREFLTSAKNRVWVESLVAALQVRSETLVQLSEHAAPFVNEEVEWNPKAVKKALKPAAREPLERIRDWVSAQESLADEEAIHAFLTGLAEELELKMGRVAQPLRVAVTGRMVSPPINTTLVLLGKDRVLRRIEDAMGRIVEPSE